MTVHPLPPPLPDDVLAARATLPKKPLPVTLTGRYVRLEPFDFDRDLEALFAVSNGQPVTLGDRHVAAYDADVMVWRFMSGGPFETAEAMIPYFETQLNAPDGTPLTVFDVASGRQVGVTNYMANYPEHLKIELGGIWYSPIVQRTWANTEATYLMLGHAFDLGYRRLEWKCHSLNLRSWQAAEKMGFTFEGVQAYHYIVKGRNRDTAWFRILDHEWPSVKARLEQRMYAENAGAER